MSTVKRIASTQLDQIKAALVPLRDAIRDQQPEFSVNGSMFKTPAAQAFTVENVRTWANTNQPYIGKTNADAARAAAQQIESGELDGAMETLANITMNL
jgi:hypothetical protein